MITLLRCGDCYGIFDEALADKVDFPEPFEYFGERGIHTYVLLCCPYCGSTEVSEQEAPEPTGDVVEDLMAAGAL